MSKIFNSDIDDAFACTMYQKFLLKAEKETTFSEIENFMHEFLQELRNDGFEVLQTYSRNSTEQFLDDYQEYLNYDRKTGKLSLKDGISFSKFIDVFHIGTLSYEVLKMLINGEIGTRVFNSQSENDDQPSRS